MSQIKLFENNRAWAKSVNNEDPEFFQRLALQQAPEYLWIGCADSRVPPNQVVGLGPGEMFVHRNIANVVVHTDLNCLSVLQYAVEVLKVKHVIVCGHFGCGGVRAALDNANYGLIDNWLRHIQDVRRKYQAVLDSLPDDQLRFDRLCELNVIEQVLHVSETTVLQDAWLRGQEVTVHGWIYSLEDGLLCDIGITARSPAEMDIAYSKIMRGLGPVPA